MEVNQIYQGDCLTVMQQIPDKSIDMILCDLPYGTTQNSWDSVIDLGLLWQSYERIIKDCGAIVLTAQTPFDKILGCSKINLLRYEWIWQKSLATGHLNSKFAPLKQHENILVFSAGISCFTKTKKTTMKYNPQFEKGKPYICKSGQGSSNYNSQKSVVTINQGIRYPKSILNFTHDKTKYHPTQKPVALFEYLIKTYTDKGETVLDNCIGSGTTAIACLNTGRNFIGIEKDLEIYKGAQARVQSHVIPIISDIDSII